MHAFTLVFHHLCATYNHSLHFPCQKQLLGLWHFNVQIYVLNCTIRTIYLAFDADYVGSQPAIWHHLHKKYIYFHILNQDTLISPNASLYTNALSIETRRIQLLDTVRRKREKVLFMWEDSWQSTCEKRGKKRF